MRGVLYGDSKHFNSKVKLRDRRAVRSAVRVDQWGDRRKVSASALPLAGARCPRGTRPKRSWMLQWRKAMPVTRRGSTLRFAPLPCPVDRSETITTTRSG